MRTPKPFTVYQPIAGQSAKPLFTVHAYSIEPGPRDRRRKASGRDHRCRPGLAGRSKSVIPDTRGGLNAMATVSAMQKAIRRGMEREAMEFACELMHTSKAFHSTVCNRLEVICHEDLDTIAAPRVFPFVAASLAASRERYSKSIGEARLMVGNVIRIMCRVPKSRAGCHFAAAIGLRSSLESLAPEIPDWALDQHTLKGKAMGRGLDHFRREGAKLVLPPIGDDPYEDEAYRLWLIKQRSK